MDLEEILLLSSDDEMVSNPDQNPSDEADEWSRVFFDPADLLRVLEESLDLEKALEGTHSPSEVLPILA